MAKATDQHSRVAAVPVIKTAPVEVKSNHFGDLEEQVCDLVQAADLSASILEHALSHQRLDENYFGKPYDVSRLVDLPKSQSENLIFAAYEVLKRAKALRDFVHDPKGVLSLSH